jgi:Tfp pilus assembly protein PilN
MSKNDAESRFWLIVGVVLLLLALALSLGAS